MGSLSRLTRNRYGRWAFDALDSLGVRLTWMCEYVRELDDVRDDGQRPLAAAPTAATDGASESARDQVAPAVAHAPTANRADARDSAAGDTDASITVEICDPERVEALDAPVEKLIDGEEVLGAFEDGSPRGYLFLSVDAPDDFQPMEWPTSFDGAYIRGVYVAADHRNRGIASALVERACRRATERGASRAIAMVSVENGPSRALFEKIGFEVTRDHRYVRVGPFSRLFVRER